MRRHKILIIDDDAELLETAAQLLVAHGFEVVIHRAAINRLHVIREFRPDAVLMDVNMPLLPGDEVTRLMRDIHELRHISVFLFSSNDEASLRRMAVECGADGYISKSEMGTSFAARVARRLQGHPIHMERMDSAAPMADPASTSLKK